jgi:hypothetical protein
MILKLIILILLPMFFIYTIREFKRLNKRRRWLQEFYMTDLYGKLPEKEE